MAAPDTPRTRAELDAALGDATVVSIRQAVAEAPPLDDETASVLRRLFREGRAVAARRAAA